MFEKLTAIERFKKSSDKTLEAKRTSFRQGHVHWVKGEITTHIDKRGKEYEVIRYHGTNVGRVY